MVSCKVGGEYNMLPKDVQPVVAPSGAPSRVKRAYEPPKLVSYGSVAKLTHGTHTVGTDSTPGTMRNHQCL